MMKLRRILFAALMLIILGLGLSGFFYFRSERFQEGARKAIIGRIEKATGMRAGIDRFSISFWRGSFSLDGLELKTRKETGNRFELGVAQVSGSFRLMALWRPKIDLGELILIRPRIRILQEPGGGSWRLGTIMRKSLDIAARRASIQDGWVELNNRRIPLSLTVERLNCSIRYRPNPQSYAIDLSYRNSPLQWRSRKFVYDLNARLGLLPDGLAIHAFELRENKSHFNGTGSLRNWDAPALQVHAAGIFSSDDLTLLTADLKDARGDVSVIGDLRWDARGFYSTGTFTAGTVRYRKAESRELHGFYEIRDNVLLLRDVNGSMGKGSFRVEGVVQLSAANAASHHFRISATDVTIRDASGALPLRGLDLENTVDAEATVDWRHGLADLVLESAVTMHGLPPGEGESGSRTSLDGTVEFSYRNRTWHLNKAKLSSQDTRIEAAGKDAVRSRIVLETSRCAEVLQVLRYFSPSLETLLWEEPDLREIAGRYRLDGELTLRLPGAVSYEGQVSVAHGRWRTFSVDSLSAVASWNASRLRLRALKAQRDAQSAEGELEIGMPADHVGPGFSFGGTLRGIALSQLREAGIAVPEQVSGVLSGRGRFSYGQNILLGGGVFRIEEGSFNGRPFDLLTATVQVDRHEVLISDSQISRGSAAISTRGRINLETRELDLSARLREQPLLEIQEIKSSGLAIDGRVTASAEIRGTLETPEARANVDLVDLRYAGWSLGAGRATVELHAKSLAALFSVQSDLGGFRGEAQLAIGGGYPGRAALEFLNWNVQKIFADNAPAIFSDLTTALHGNLVIEGPFSDPARLTFRGDMDGARFKIHGYELRNEGKIRFIAQNRRVSVKEARLTGEGSSLELAGDIPYSSGPALNLRLNGRLNLGFLNHLAPEVGVSGSTMLDVSASGSLSAPEIIGRAVLEDTRLEWEDLPYPLSALNGDLVFSRNAIRLEGLRGAMAGGTIQLNGSLEHQNGALRGINLQASLDNVRLRYPKDFVSTIDAQLNLRGGAETQVLTGDVTVLRAEYLRDFSVLEQIIGRPSSPPDSRLADSPLAGVRLNVSVHSENGLYIDNELARVQGGMSLTLRGSLAYPAVIGRVEAREGAIFFRGTRFDISRAAADFVDRNRINPVFEIRAEADLRSYRVRLDVSGDLEHMRLNVTSDPPLSTVDIVSLLTTGKSEESAISGVDNSRRQAEMAGLSAASILSESLTGVIGKRVERIFGLKSFRVDPFPAGTENDPTARVTISERLSQVLTVTYSRNLTTNNEQIVVIEYDVSRSLSIVATYDENGNYGIDFRFRKRFR